MSPNQWIHSTTMKNFTAFPVHYKSLTESNLVYWLQLVSDWLDSLIGPIGLLLLGSSLSPSCYSQFQFMDGVGKKLLTKTWMWKIFLLSHMLSAYLVWVEMLHQPRKRMLRQRFKVQTLSAPKLLGQILHTIFNQYHCHHPSIYQLSSTHYCYPLSNFEGDGEKGFLNPFLCGHLALLVNLKLLGLLP
jgi:hypothetical protein